MALWTPSEISTALWLDGADSSTLFDATSGGSLVAADGAIARWEDKSGNGRHITQSNGGARPLRRLSILNGLDAVHFSGGRRLLGTSFTAIPGINAVVFSRTGSWPSDTSIGSSRQTGTWGWRGGVSPANVNTLARFGYVAAYLNGSSSVELNSVGTPYTVPINTPLIVSAESASETEISQTWGIGYDIFSGSRTMIGYIHEWIQVPLTTNESIRQKVEGYLAHKWGLSSNLPIDHPYKTVPPTTGTIQTRRRRSHSGGYGL